MRSLRYVMFSSQLFIWRKFCHVPIVSRARYPLVSLADSLSLPQRTMDLLMSVGDTLRLSFSTSS